MLLYKFRSLENLEFVLDIIINERLYCARYKDLNDPFEGQLLYAAENIISPGILGASVSSTSTKRLITADDLSPVFEPKRVCSLSKTANDVRMWSLYADSHKGVAIEIDLDIDHDPGVVAALRAVTYTKTLSERGGMIGIYDEDQLLTIKTDHWRYEDEYRLLWHEPFFSNTGCVKRLVFGPRADQSRIDLLRKVVPKHIEFVQAKLDYDDVAVVFRACK
tara:strand:- start:750 stop:1409 length:660 start_codon:yes stop_codon:yes gene_type:complete